MMTWKVIVDDDKVNLFPFVYWPDAYSTGWKEIIGTNLKNTLLEFKNSKFRYFIEKEEWRTVGEQVFEKIKNTSFGEKLIELNENKVKDLYFYCREISETNFGSISNSELKKINENYSKQMIEANRVGLFISILEYENNILSDELEKYLNHQVKKLGLSVNASEIFAVQITPRKDNLMQQELERYHELIKEFKSKKKLIEKFNEPFEEFFDFFKKNETSLFKKFCNHTKDFCWIRYNYEGPAFTEKQLLEKIIKDVSLNNKIPERISKEQLIQEQEKNIKKLKINADYQRLFSLTREYMYWKTMRRDVQSFAFFVFEAFQREIAGRFSFSLKEVRQLHYNEINSILAGEKIDRKKLQERQKHSIYLLENGETSILSGKRALEKSKEIFEEEIDKEAKLLKGNCAMPGKVEGIARIINKEEEFFKLKDSEILVSFATTPDMSSIIKKASAIVTDQGGITCHAAIISRELKIPCVVGTKMATKIINDGEKIQVDASNGTVKRLEANK